MLRLQTVVDGDDVELRVLVARIALVPDPAHLVPGVALARGHVGHEIHADETGPRLRFGLELVDVELARGLVRDDAVRHALLANARGQRARIDARDADDAAGLQPRVEMLGGAIVRRLRDVGAQHAAAHARARGEVRRLAVFLVGADVADVREA